MLNNMTTGGGQIQGARDYQEDSYSIVGQVSHQDNGALYVLADGMGGHEGGAQASELAVQGFCDSFRASQGDTAERLTNALRAANSAITDFVADNPDFEDMGTTLVGVYLEPSRKLWWVSVGDSPLWRVSNGQISQLNDDHSMGPVFDKMVELGDMTASEAKNNPKRNALRSVVHGKEIKLMDVSAEPIQLVEGDCVILASDGVESLSDDAIKNHVMQQANAEHLVSAILHDIDSKQLPHQDNATLIALKLAGTNNSSPSSVPAPAVQEAPNAPLKQSTNQPLLIAALALIVLVVIALGAVLFGSSEETVESEIPPVATPNEPKDTTKNAPPAIELTVEEEPHDINDEPLDFDEDTLENPESAPPTKSDDEPAPEVGTANDEKDPSLTDSEPPSVDGKGESDILQSDSVQQPESEPENNSEEDACELQLDDEESCAQAQSTNDGTE